MVQHQVDTSSPEEPSEPALRHDHPIQSFAPWSLWRERTALPAPQTGRPVPVR